MGRDKAQMMVEGETLAARTARLLASVAHPVLEVGPGVSGLPVAPEPDPRDGPLPAIAAGWVSLLGLGYRGDVLVLSTDLPRLTAPALSWLAGRAGESSVVPIVGGSAQLLCARWCADDLDGAVALVAAGERVVRRALGPETAYPSEEEFGTVTSAGAFADVDTPGDLEALGYKP